MKREVIGRVAGTSTSGTPHGLLIERTDGGMTLLTIVGADGKKRHASVRLGQLSTAMVSHILGEMSNIVQADIVTAVAR